MYRGEKEGFRYRGRGRFKVEEGFEVHREREDFM